MSSFSSSPAIVALWLLWFSVPRIASAFILPAAAVHQQSAMGNKQRPSSTTGMLMTVAAKTHDASRKRILEVVLGLPQMEGKTLLHLAVVGSRSKQLASQDSDYDVIAVILHSTNDYLLQQVTGNESFKTDIVDPLTGEPTWVEGILVDFLTIKKYVLNSKFSAYEALFGMTLYKTPSSGFLKQLYCKAYNPKVMLASYQGQLREEEKIAKKRRLQDCVKYVANRLYYASIVIAVHTNDEPPPELGAFALLDRISIKPELRQQIEELYNQRKVDKSRMNVKVDPFIVFLRRASDLTLPERTQPRLVMAALEEEANRVFLELVLPKEDQKFWYKI